MPNVGYKVVYLTGAPATGKSTLVTALEKRITPLITFSYSKELAKHISRQNRESYSQDDMRQRSATLITPQDVAEVDAALIQLVRDNRSSSHIIIDSHPVTKESYGYRVTPFTLSQLNQIHPDIIILLYTEPQIVIKRIISNSQGRPKPSTYEAALHNDLQASVALIYGIQLGVPIYLLDSAKPVENLVCEFCRLLHPSGIPASTDRD